MWVSAWWRVRRTTSGQILVDFTRSDWSRLCASCLPCSQVSTFFVQQGLLTLGLIPFIFVEDPRLLELSNEFFIRGAFRRA